MLGDVEEFSFGRICAHICVCVCLICIMEIVTESRRPWLGSDE